jgi:hypothetical protein
VTLLYFAPVPWDSYLQRPHFFVRHFLDVHGGAVVWVDPYPTRLPVWRDLRRARTAPLATPRPAGLTVIRLPAVPVEPLPGGRWLNRSLLGRALLDQVRPSVEGQSVGIAVGRPSVLALAVLDTLPHAWSVYDAMDDFPEFYTGLSRRSVRETEAAIAARVGLIIVSSSRLWTKFGGCGTPRVRLPNAFDMAALPAIEERRAAPPVFGYVGCVSGWFDWEIVIALAACRPDVRVEIIGPRAETPRTLPANVVLRPACSHEETIEHLRRFSAGLIPFHKTLLTEAVDPIKYYAYRAMGLPVLSTRFGEMVRHGAGEGTYFIDAPTGVAAAAEAALAYRGTPDDVRRFRAEHDWRSRFEMSGVFDRLAETHAVT